MLLYNYVLTEKKEPKPIVSFSVGKLMKFDLQMKNGEMI